MAAATYSGSTALCSSLFAASIALFHWRERSKFFWCTYIWRHLSSEDDAMRRRRMHAYARCRIWIAKVNDDMHASWIDHSCFKHLSYQLQACIYGRCRAIWSTTAPYSDVVWTCLQKWGLSQQIEEWIHWINYYSWWWCETLQYSSIEHLSSSFSCTMETLDL
jgi:hypothetical protein